eukprot:TCALIF_11365-PB protein Name:"Protein of unknown function" AED:0.41 eAED:0.62 QI:0/0.25/0.2/0.6/0.75/0.8/5/0/354
MSNQIMKIEDLDRGNDGRIPSQSQFQRVPEVGPDFKSRQVKLMQLTLGIHQTSIARVKRPASVYGGLVAKIKRHPRVFPRVMCLCRALGHLMVHISLMARIDPQFWPRALPILELDMEKTRGIFMSQSFNDVLLLFGLPFSFGSDRLALPILQDLILCFIKLLSLYLLKVNYNLDSIYMSVVLGIAGFLKINTYEDPLNTGTIFLITFWCYCLVRNVPSFLVGLLFSVEEMLANNQNPTAIFHEYVVVDFTSFMIFGGATGLSVLFSQWNGLIEDPLGLPQWVMEHLGQTPMGVITMALSFCALSCITNKWFRAALNYLANIPFLEDTINKGVYPGKQNPLGANDGRFVILSFS